MHERESSRCLIMRRTLSIAFMFLMLALCGCVTTPVVVRTFEPPAWFVDAHKTDHAHVYFKEIGESRMGASDSRADARRRLEISTRDYILDESDAREVGGDTRNAFSLSGLEIFHESEPRRESGRWKVYILGRLPRVEYDRIVSRIRLGRQLTGKWGDAQSMVSAGNHSEAIGVLENLIKKFDSSLDLRFRKVDAEWLVAQACLRSGNTMRARRVLIELQNCEDSRIARRAVEKLKQLPNPGPKDYFHGLDVVLVTGKKKSGKIVNCRELQEELKGRLIHEGYRLLAPKGEYIDKVSAGLQTGDFTDLTQSVGGNVVFLALLSVDEEKFGKMVSIPFSEGKMPAIDSSLFYYVIRSDNGAVIVSGKTQTASNGSLKRAISGLANTILTHRNHLPASGHLISGFADQSKEKSQ